MNERCVRAVQHQALCPHCGSFVPFVLFEGGLEQAETLLGTATGSLYLLHDESIRYDVLARASALAPAEAREAAAGGTLVRAVDHICCHGCTGTFALRDVEDPPPGVEIQVSAFRLPSE